MLKLSNSIFKISNRFTIGPINLRVGKGSHVAIIGESGCGKTTLLKMVYGLYDTDKGNITWNDNLITGPEENLIPGMPFIKYLSQDFDLMPFTSVEENIHKHLSRLEPVESKRRTEELLDVVEMTTLAKVKVKTLSGGQKQRVALAQTLARKPEILLLDEPFSHIDNFRKNKLRRRLFSYLKEQQITCLVATHDSTDVLAFMDYTFVMKVGKIVAQGDTDSLFKNPPSHYVGSLFGDINEVPKCWFYKNLTGNDMLLVYPHQLSVATSGLVVTVVHSYFMGPHYLIIATRDSTPILFNAAQSYPDNSELYVVLNKLL